MMLDTALGLFTDHIFYFVLLFLLAWLGYLRYGYGISQFPGPVAASFTPLWRVWNVLTTVQDLPMVKVHQEYGDIVRISPNSLSFGHPRAIRDIYGPQGLTQKGDMYSLPAPTARGVVIPVLFASLDKTWHDNIRRRINSAFSMTALVKYEPYVDTTIDVFLRKLEEKFCEKPGKEGLIDFPIWLQYYAFDVLGELTYGQRHGFLDNGQDLGNIIHDSHTFLTYCYIVLQWPRLDKLFYKNPIKLWLNRLGLFNRLDPAVAFAMEHQKHRWQLAEDAKTSIDDSSPETLTDRFIRASKEHPDTVTPNDVLSLGLDMLFAGSETTSITLGAIFYYILKNPRVYERLEAELDAVKDKISASGSLPFSIAHGLPYLQACIKESFRMHPAARFTPERVVPPSGATICGHFIPGGTVVGVNAWVIHRRSDIFGEDVDQFRPERWLEEGADSRERIQEMERNLIHFGYGNYTCIGKNISLLEMYKLVPAVFSKFKVTLENPEKGWQFAQGGFVQQKDFYIRLEKR